MKTKIDIFDLAIVGMNFGRIFPETSCKIIEGVWKSPTTNERRADEEWFTAWNNPSNAYSSDDQYATTGVDAGLASQVYYNFGFDLPPNAIINGIEVAAEGKVNRLDICKAPKFLIALTKDRQTFWWTREGDTLTTSDSILTIGGSTDLFSQNWAPSDFGPNFGVGVSVNCASYPTTYYYLDHIQAKVYYSLP